jgi:hypothetical protein
MEDYVYSHGFKVQALATPFVHCTDDT